jgi:hypothetical protein
VGQGTRWANRFVPRCAGLSSGRFEATSPRCRWSSRSVTPKTGDARSSASDTTSAAAVRRAAEVTQIRISPIRKSCTV